MQSMWPEKTKAFMKMAYAIANMGKCPRRKVGCVLLDSYDRVISTGYNGPPRGFTACESPCSRKSGMSLEMCSAIHAEMNALMFCNDIMKIHSVLVTTLPCNVCARMLLNTSMAALYYCEDYASKPIVQVLQNAGIIVERLDKDEL